MICMIFIEIPCIIFAMPACLPAYTADQTITFISIVCGSLRGHSFINTAYTIFASMHASLVIY